MIRFLPPLPLAFTLKTCFGLTSVCPLCSSRSPSAYSQAHPLRSPSSSNNPPRLPTSLMRGRREARRYDDFHEAMALLQEESHLEAISSLQRVMDILLVAIDDRDRQLKFYLDRAMAHVAQCAGDWEGELMFRLKSVSRYNRLMQFPPLKNGESCPVPETDKRLHLQTVTSALAAAMMCASQTHCWDEEDASEMFDSFDSALPRHASLISYLAVPHDMITSNQKTTLDNLLSTLKPFPLSKIISPSLLIAGVDMAEDKEEVEQKTIATDDESPEEAEMKLGFGEFYMLKGDLYQHVLHLPDKAQKQYKLAVAWLSKTKDVCAVGLMRGGLQCPLAFALLKEGGEKQVNDGLAMMERCLGAEHPSLAIALHLASIDYGRRGKLIEAEELSRTAIDKLKSYLVPRTSDTLVKHYMSPAMVRTLQLHAILHYNELLSKNSFCSNKSHQWRNTTDELRQMCQLNRHLHGVADARWQQRPGADVWYWLWERLSISE